MRHMSGSGAGCDPRVFKTATASLIVGLCWMERFSGTST